LKQKSREIFIPRLSNDQLSFINDQLLFIHRLTN